MKHDERWLRRLSAFHDGELSGLARWQVARQLDRDPAARRELDSLAEIGNLLREVEAEGPTPEVWEAIRARLPRPAAGEAREVAKSPSWSWSPQWLGAGLAAAATALALAIGLEWGDASDPRSVRWLDSGGKPALVLQDDSEATIIWLLETSDQAFRGNPRNTAGRSRRVVS